MAAPTRPAAVATPTKVSAWRRLLRGIGAGPAEIEAENLRAAVADLGATAITECCLGERVSVAGTLRSVTLRPHGGVPALEADLYDGSATIRLIWLGRRRIGGITPGANISAHGRLTTREGVPTVFNPSYELRA